MAIKRSLIKLFSWIPSSQFCDDSLSLPKKCLMDCPFYCFVVRSLYLSKVKLRVPMNASSLFLQSSTVVNVFILKCEFRLHAILLPSVSWLRYKIETAWRCAWFRGLSPHMTPKSICRWQQFPQFVSSQLFAFRLGRNSFYCVTVDRFQWE